MNDFILASKELIYKNGVDVTFVTVTEGAYDSDTGSVTNTEVETTVKGYPKNVKANTFNYPNLVGKEATEWLVVASDLSTIPTPQDKVKRGSKVYSVDSVRDIVAEGESVIYKVLVVK